MFHSKTDDESIQKYVYVFIYIFILPVMNPGYRIQLKRFVIRSNSQTSVQITEHQFYFIKCSSKIFDEEYSYI